MIDLVNLTIVFKGKELGTLTLYLEHAQLALVGLALVRGVRRPRRSRAVSRR